MVGGDDDESVIVWIRIGVSFLSKPFRDADGTIKFNRLPDGSFCIHPVRFLIYGRALNHQEESVWAGCGKRPAWLRRKKARADVVPSPDLFCAKIRLNRHKQNLLRGNS